MKKLFSFLCVALVLSMSFTPVYASETNLKLNSQYAYLYDQDTSLEYITQKSDEKMYPASMTKILTVSLALEKIADIKEKVIIEKKDLDGLIALGATTAGFYVGEKVTYEDLLYGALLPSGADACNALARLTYGSLVGMVDAMNIKIQKLGLKNTHFQNVTGLHDVDHYTTAKDMAMILNSALKSKDFKTIFEARKHTDSKGKRTWVSSLQRAQETKKIDISHINGAKSGFTDEAQLTLASTMTYEGHHFILVTAKAKGQRTQNNVKDANTVYQYLTENFQKFVIYKKEETIHTYYVFKSFEGFYDLKAQNDLSIIIDKNINTKNIEVTYDGKTIIGAPITKNDQLGKTTIKYQDKELYQFQITVNQEIEGSILATIIHYLFISVIVAIVLLFVVRKIYRIRRKNKKKKARR